jgi:hypothetical protein
LINIAGKFNLK